MRQNYEMAVCSDPMRSSILVPVMDSIWAAEVFGPLKQRKSAKKNPVAAVKSIFRSYKGEVPETARGKATA